MTSSRSLVSCVVLGAAFSLACSAAKPPVVSSSESPKPAASTIASNATNAEDQPPVGHVTRAEVEALPKWIAARQQDDTIPDAEAARALKDVPAGATVRVFFGTWCGDSRREVTRLWKALDLAGGGVPFALEYVAVDRAKTAPGGLTDGIGLRYVPTFVVVRAGKEVGRIIESSPGGLEKDLRALLKGERTGVISSRSDVGA